MNHMKLSISMHREKKFKFAVFINIRRMACYVICLSYHFLRYETYIGNNTSFRALDVCRCTNIITVCLNAE